MAIVGYYNIEDLKQKDAPLGWQKRGLQQTASGYGRKLTTRRMVKIPGSKRWRRVYCAQFSNAGTCYVTQGKDWIVIR